MDHIPSHPHPHRFITHNSPSRFMNRVIVIIGVIVLVLVLSLTSITSSVVNGIHDAAAGTLYRLHRQSTDETPFALFTSQNSIFTKRISTDTLLTLLKNRRRVIGGTVNNTLVVACANTKNLHPQVVSSWISVRGVREVIFVHYTSSREDSEHGLRVIDGVDRLGRILYVSLVGKDGNKDSDNESMDTYLEPPGHAQRWERARAFNLGVGLASGTNLLFTDCNSMIAADALMVHPLSNGTLYVNVGHDRHHASDMKSIEMMYVAKDDFIGANGFDERVDVPGFEMADLVERLSQSSDLQWDTMDESSSRAAYVPGGLALSNQYRVSGIHTLEDGATLIPELALFVSAFARDELPPWNGKLSDGTPSMLTLQPVVFRVLRSHFDSVDGHSRKLSMFVPSMRSDFRLWVHASLRKNPPASMVDALPRESRAKVLLQAHRKLLHDHHGLPRELLTMIENVEELHMANRTTSNGTFIDVGNKTNMSILEEKIEAYSPLMFDVLWRKSKLLVVNIEADYAMELFRGVAWAVSLAIVQSRTLMLVGDLQGTPLVHVLNVTEMSEILSREYNVKLDIIGRPHLVNCSVESHASCWQDDAVVKRDWSEHRVIAGISDLHDDPSKHVLMHIAGRDVIQWDDGEKSTLWQKQLEVHAYACISVSDVVKEIIRQNEEKGWNNVAGRTALWITRSSRDAATVKAFAYGYLKQRKAKQGKSTLLFLSDHSGMRENEDPQFNVIRNMAELWVAMQCRRIVFDSEEAPVSWKGTDESILEWRRIHSGSNGKGGVVHVRLSKIRGAVAFHEITFVGDGVKDKKL